ncbi:MAG: alanine racemase [Calditrichaeota bacterium]|nr:alanine racemase [Calditrichota bacterium]
MIEHNHIPVEGRPTYALIDCEALRQNLDLVRQLANGRKIMAIVKADAYGHGMVGISRELISERVDFLGVAMLDEGLRLRRQGITHPILVLGGMLEGQFEAAVKNNLDLTISSREQVEPLVRVLDSHDMQAHIHIKIDTGMGRLGEPWTSAPDFFHSVASHSRIEVRGLYTHLATTESPDPELMLKQIDRFSGVIRDAESCGIYPEYIHHANSGALLQSIHHPSLEVSNMVRPGIMLYGYPPAAEMENQFDLQPVMTLKSHVVFCKIPPEGMSVGYGGTYLSKGEKYIATLPVGYGDGYPRRCGNRAYLCLNSQRVPVVGNVSMDMITVEIDQAFLGDEAMIFGRSNGQSLSLWELAQQLDTIPYEILCGIAPRVPRLFINSRVQEQYREDRDYQ